MNRPRVVYFPSGRLVYFSSGVRNTYFVYKAGTRWSGAEMPPPDFWYHQLQDREVWERTADDEFGTTEWTQALAEKSEADPAHFATGDGLRIALADALRAAAATSGQEQVASG
jgi:hypothetical protein